MTAAGQVYVRTWYRRSTGWFGHAVGARRARVRVPALEADVVIDDLGTASPEVRAAVDAAYRDEYGTNGSVDRMVADEAAATTLRLVPARA